MSPNRVTVKLSVAQRDVIMQFIKKYPELGYKSYADFVADAVREKFLELKREVREEEERVPIGRIFEKPLKKNDEDEKEEEAPPLKTRMELQSEAHEKDKESKP